MVEFQEKLSTLLILSLAVYIKYVSYRVKQNYAHKKLCSLNEKNELIFRGKNCEIKKFDIKLISTK